MYTVTWSVALSGLCAGLCATISPPLAFAADAAPKTGFGFNAPDISGFPTGAVSLTGGGAFNLSSGFANSAGGFRCLADVLQGPLRGCLAAEGVRWDTSDLLNSTT